MRVRMKVTVSGMRNGQPWPARGEVVELPDDEAQQYIDAGMAQPAGALGKVGEVETATVSQDDVEKRGPLTTKTGPAAKRKRS